MKNNERTKMNHAGSRGQGKSAAALEFFWQLKLISGRFTKPADISWPGFVCRSLLRLKVTSAETNPVRVVDSYASETQRIPVHSVGWDAIDNCIAEIPVSRILYRRFVLLACIFFLHGSIVLTAVAQQNRGASEGYVGSGVCAKCHRSIYESFSKTDMGRSMSEITPALLKKISSSAEAATPRFNRHYEVFAREGRLYQSEYATNPAGQDVFRETHKLDFFIGSGANGIGGIVQQGAYLFEAPLSFYSKTGEWALSPGYEFGDYGFNRPILAGCIVCHSGRPRISSGQSAKMLDPPFAEVAIGCENCHGPGENHIVSIETGSPSSIVNPATLSPWLSSNICMSCHQAGDARVLKEGKSYSDFRPGQKLEDTLSIFIIPFDRGSAPKDDHLEHYLSMRLSNCFLKSGRQLTCITCHDPHVQPSAQEAPAYFRQKCLTCHTEKSCAIPPITRQRKTPPDDCVGCHMPKRDVTVISHSVLTNHRIVAQAEEPFPDVAFRLATDELPDLVDLSSDPSKHITVEPLTRLQAYAQIVLRRPEYRERYWALANQLKTSHGDNLYVLEALADDAVQKHTDDGSRLAIRYLQEAIKHGTNNPVDFEELAALLTSSNRETEALDVLTQGIDMAPYDANLYRQYSNLLLNQKRVREACEVIAEGAKKFPQDDLFRDLMSRCADNGQGKLTN